MKLNRRKNAYKEDEEEKEEEYENLTSKIYFNSHFIHCDFTVWSRCYVLASNPIEIDQMFLNRKFLSLNSPVGHVLSLKIKAFEQNLIPHFHVLIIR